MKKIDFNAPNILSGIPAAPGISVFSAFLYNKECESVTKAPIDNPEEAIQNLDEALGKAKKELNKIKAIALEKLGEKRAAIFEAQMMILDDPVLIKNINTRIEQERLSAEYIVDTEISKYQKLMAAADATYLKERAFDIEDIKNRIIRNLRKKKWTSWISGDVNIVTATLTPADTVLFSRSNVQGYVTVHGGLTSHAAIVARSLDIPCVVGVHDAMSHINSGDLIIVDGFNGKVIVSPNEEQIAYYNKKYEELKIFDDELLKLRNIESKTLDGKKIFLKANLDLTDEIDYIIKNGADGVGLVRTEHIFEEYEEFPDEEEQVSVYNKISEKIYPNRVIIRTLDIGGDKVLPFDVQEPNPFLGWRGIRFLEDNPKLFKTQLRAILRASSHKNIGVMIPMITSRVEILRTKALLEECKAELKAEGHRFDNNIDFGIMVEVPSAAVLAGEFAEEVDFLSVGTNDLIQYLLAVDRGNDIVSSLYQEFHPAVVQTLDHIIRNCHKAKKRISICGEMAADPLAVPLLVGLGFDSLSVSPAVIPQIKNMIVRLNYSDAKAVAAECLKLKTENEIKIKLVEFFNKNLPGAEFNMEVENDDI